MSLHAQVKAMRKWWSAEARQVFSEVADELMTTRDDPPTQEEVLWWLGRLYKAAAQDEAEGGDGVRIEAISLRRLDLQTQVGNTEDGEAIMESTPTLELRVRKGGGWRSLYTTSVEELAAGSKFSTMWDAEGLNGPS